MKKHDFFENIKNVLRGHEEPYQLGMWENFQRYRKKRQKVLVLKYVFSVAASILFVFIFNFWIVNNNEIPLNSVTVKPTETRELPETGLVENETLPHIKTEEEVYVVNEKDDQKRAKNKLLNISHTNSVFDTPEDNITHNKSLPSEDMLIIHQNSLSQKVLDLSKLIELHSKEDFEKRNLDQITDSILENEVIVDRNYQRKNLAFGFAYSPLLNISQSASDWNISAGLTIEWTFQNNFALTSGLFLSQNQLDLENNQSFKTSNTDIYDTVKMEVDFLSLELPINIQYTFVNHLFLTVGITSASFLREKYIYTYQYEDMIQRTQYVEGEGYQVITEIVTITESDKQSIPSFNSFHPLAFYNLSLGYSLDFSEKRRISIEPFVKIPASTLSSRNITYTTGGVQLKVSF